MFTNSNRRQFQKGLDMDKARASRRDNQLSLRRKSREAHLQKKKRLILSSSRENDSIPTSSEIPKLIANVMQPDNAELQLSGLTGIRKLLSIERSPPTLRILKSGIIPKVIQFMFADNKKSYKMQFEAAWIITNIAASTTECVLSVVHSGAIEGFVDCLHNATNPELANQAIWGLGNIIGEGKKLKDRALKIGVLDDLVKLMADSSNTDIEIIKTTAWCISNFCRYFNDEQNLGDVQHLIPAITKLLRETKNDEIIRDCLWSLNYLSQNEVLCDYLIRNGAVSTCMKYLHQEVAKYEVALNMNKTQKDAQLKMNHNIYNPALRFLGNLLTMEDNVTQSVLDAGYLDVIYPFTTHFISNQRREIMWSLSNILAGSHQQIEAVLSRPKLLKGIIDAAGSAAYGVRKEACWCICNTIVDSISEQKKKLAEHGAIEALCKMLKPTNNIREEHIMIIIEALEGFLSVYAENTDYNPFADRIEECQGLDYIEERLGDENMSTQAYQGLVDLMSKYWNLDHDAGEVVNKTDDQLLSAGIDAKTQQFKFGCNPLSNATNAGEGANTSKNQQYSF